MGPSQPTATLTMGVLGMPDVIGDHYVLLKVERRGGTFSVVRKAIDNRDESFVAVKLLTGNSDELDPEGLQQRGQDAQEPVAPQHCPL